eukprot:757383-Hanusia_phi.AAC.11
MGRVVVGEQWVDACLCECGEGERGGEEGGGRREEETGRYLAAKLELGMFEGININLTLSAR